jgi:hypothetical protein
MIKGTGRGLPTLAVMPAYKGQPAPDLRYFPAAGK